ncbi:MAG: hypothetical protein AABZ60_09980 [Planctomycetota bacterium]
MPPITLKNKCWILFFFLSYGISGCGMLSDHSTEKTNTASDGENFNESYELKRKADQLLFQKHTPKICEEAFESYQKAKELEPQFPGLYWRMARACHYRASYHKKGDAERKSWSKKGLDCAKKSLAEATDAQAHYYFALFTGIIADETFAPDPKIVLEIVSHAEQSSKLDPTFDYAGSYRLLGAIYLNAPSFPRSIGDKEKAVDYLKKSVREHPEYQENQLLLGEALFLWSQILAEEEDFFKEAKQAYDEAYKAIQRSLELPPLPDREHLKNEFDLKAKELLKSIEENPISEIK